MGTVRFDKAFNLQSDRTLYCTELVYKAYLGAGVDIINGEFDVIDLPWLDAREVILPSGFIEGGLFDLVYSSIHQEDGG